MRPEKQKPQRVLPSITIVKSPNIHYVSDMCVNLPDPGQRKSLCAPKIIRTIVNHLGLGIEPRILSMIGKHFTSLSQGLYFQQKEMHALENQSTRSCKLVVNTLKKIDRVWFSNCVHLTCKKPQALFLTLEEGHPRTTQNLGLVR